MLEQKIEELIAALDRNTAALGGKAAPAADKAPAAGKGKADKAPAAAKPKHNKDEVMALAQQVAQQNGGPAAKAIISETGGAAKIADVPDSKLDALFEAFTAALGAGSNTEEEEEL